mgnify:CR=1 FL=1
MNDYDNRKEEIIKKLEQKFNKAGIPGGWAHNAARRVVEMWENSDRSKESFERAVYTVYRGLWI